MSVNDSKPIPKLFAVLGVFLLVVAVSVLLSVPPASGYEIYIYTAYPWYFWVSIVGAIVAGQLVVLSSADNDDLGTFGAMLAIGSVVTLTLLPYVRGYPVYGRADVLTHLGMVHDIGEFGIAGNIYPPTHLLVGALSGATGLEPMTLINVLPVAFTVVFLGSMYLLVEAQFVDRKRAAFALPFVLLPVLGSSHVTAVPFVLSLLLTPFALYLLVSERRTAAVPVRAMLVLAVVGVVLFHPLTALFFLAALVVYAASERVLAADGPSPSPTNVASLTVVVFGAWYLSFVGILIRFRNVVTGLLSRGGGESQLQGTVDTVERTSAEMSDVLKIAVLEYGATGVFYGLATTFLAAVVLWWLMGRVQPRRFVAVFGATTVLFAGLSVVFLTNDLIVGFGRPLAFGKIFAAVLAGGVWYAVWQRTDRTAGRAAVAVALGALLVVVVLLSVASMFSSPLVAKTNQQVTQMELDGMEWTFENRNEELLIDEFGIDQYRFYDMRNGLETSSETVRRSDTNPPAHFNYTTYETLGRSYESDRYFVLTRLGRITYPAKFPGYRDQWQYTPADFDRLEYDSSVGQVYDNGEFDTYHVNGTRRSTGAERATTAGRVPQAR
jgi:hypothetical protein